MKDMEKLRLRVLRAFGVAPWSEEAKGLTDEMCLDYAEFLDSQEEKLSSGSFDENAFFSAREREYASAASLVPTAEKPVSEKADISAMSDFIEREMRCRDTGFITY